MRLRHKMVGVHLEESLYDLLWQVSKEEAQTNSTFMRSLLLQDLQRRGMIPPEVMLILSGGPSSRQT